MSANDNIPNEEEGDETMKQAKDKMVKCEMCGEKIYEACMQTVRVTYAVDGQTILDSEKKICANCNGGVANDVYAGRMFPAKGPRAKYQPIPHHDRHGKPCHDCGAREGEQHKNGCDWERCPVCGGQLFSCGHGNQVPLPKSTSGATHSTETK